MREHILDDLDRSIITAIKAGPGATVLHIATQCIQSRSERTIRDRIEWLKRTGHIQVYRETPRGKMRCYPPNWPLPTTKGVAP